MRRRSSSRLDYWLSQPYRAPAPIVSDSGYLVRHSPLGPAPNICPQSYGFNIFLLTPGQPRPSAQVSVPRKSPRRQHPRRSRGNLRLARQGDVQYILHLSGDCVTYSRLYRREDFMATILRESDIEKLVTMQMALDA